MTVHSSPDSEARNCTVVAAVERIMPGIITIKKQMHFAIAVWMWQINSHSFV
jgi:hypothetical protein